MVNNKTLLLLNGSPRKNKTSYSFARTIKLLAEEKGLDTRILHVIDYFDGKNDLKDLKSTIIKSDITGIIAPVYVDTLPYPVIWLFERLCEEFKNHKKGNDFFAIGQCGFPNPDLCQPLIRSCRSFSMEAGMNWLGGLAYGGGPMIDGAYLEQMGKRGEKIINAFELMLNHIIEGERIPKKAQDLLTIKIPKILYRPMAAFLNYRAREKARNYGTDIREKAYLFK